MCVCVCECVCVFVCTVVWYLGRWKPNEQVPPRWILLSHTLTWPIPKHANPFLLPMLPFAPVLTFLVPSSLLRALSLPPPLYLSLSLYTTTHTHTHTHIYIYIYIYIYHLGVSEMREVTG